MCKHRLLLTSILLVTAFSWNVFAACPNEVYFKNGRVQYPQYPISKPLYIDVDLDGKKDLIDLGSYAMFYKRNASDFNTVPVLTNLHLPEHYTVIAGNAGDLNGDGLIDALISFTNGNTWLVAGHLGSGDGSFAPEAPHRNYGVQEIFGLADLNGDSKADLVGMSFGNIVVGTVQPDLGFVTLRTFPGYSTAKVADFNGDGKTDILVWKNGPAVNELVLFTNLGGAVFAQGPTITSVVSSARPDLVSDINNDGKLDVVTGIYADANNPAVSRYTVFLNSGKGGFTKTSAELTLAPGSAVNKFPPVAGDLDNDGDKDILFGGESEYFVGFNNGSGAMTTQRFAPGLPGVFSLEDMDADGKADPMVLNRSYAALTSGGALSIGFKKNQCTALGQTRFLDFNKDSQSDVATWRPSNGRWTFRYLNQDLRVSWGLGELGDIPAPQDYDGDGYTDIAVFRASTGVWYIWRSSDGGYTITQFGADGDKPVPADFDGDGKADIAIFRPANGVWFVWLSATSSLYGGNWGLTGDVPLPMDYDGDNKADLAVFRPADAAWYILRSSDSNFTYAAFGLSTDKPIPADYDNDGIADIAVFRDHNWYIMRATDGQVFYHAWGQAGDIPVPIYHSALGSNPTLYRPGEHKLYEGFTQPVPMTGTAGERIVSYILPLD